MQEDNISESCLIVQFSVGHFLCCRLLLRETSVLIYCTRFLVLRLYVFLGVLELLRPAMVPIQPPVRWVPGLSRG